jgi:hypothetical protein
MQISFGHRSFVCKYLCMPCRSSASGGGCQLQDACIAAAPAVAGDAVSAAGSPETSSDSTIEQGRIFFLYK